MDGTARLMTESLTQVGDAVERVLPILAVQEQPTSPIPWKILKEAKGGLKHWEINDLGA